MDHSGCDVRTAINTLQLLARQHAPGGSHPARPLTPSSSTQQGGSQRRGPRVRITAADIAASGAFGVKDVTHTPMGVVQDMLASNSSKVMAARLQQLAAAMRAEQQGAAAGGPSRHGRRGSRGAVPPASLSAAAAARLVLQEHYNTLLDLGEHEQVRPAGAHTRLLHGGVCWTQLAIQGLPGRRPRLHPGCRVALSVTALLNQQEPTMSGCRVHCHLQVMCVLHESLPDLVGLDVDLACTTAAADALADADLLMASGRGGAGGSASSWQYVPAPLLNVVGLVRRDAAGVGVMGSAGLNLAWPRAQVGSFRQQREMLACSGYTHLCSGGGWGLSPGCWSAAPVCMVANISAA